MQGCLLRLPLTLRHASLVDGTVEEVAQVHDLWLIADQDCDLAWRAILDSEDDEFLIELRPVFSDGAPVDWGIRSQKFLIDEDGHHLQTNAPTMRVTPSVIMAAEHVQCLDEDHQLRLKTWMGLRYDRPAVPQRYMKLAKSLADALSTKRDRSKAARYRDVLAQYRDGNGVTEFSLVAVIPGGSYAPTSDEVIAARTWLADAVRDLPADLGVAASIDAYGDSDLTLEYLENSYSVDLSKLSWPPNHPGPSGAV